MKVIGINGSPRKTSNSAAMLESALGGAASAGAETRLWHLIDLDFSGCRSCFACKRLGGPSFGRCAVRDDLSPVLDEILAADALVVSMPIYFGDVPGMVRNFFERLWYPALLYSKDGAIAYERKYRVGLLYTMNAPTDSYFRAVIDRNASTCERFLGSTQSLCAVDTLQYSDYSLYAGEMFDAAEKQRRHREDFPDDLRRAFELGAALAAES